MTEYLKDFFDYIIQLQQLGYSIHSIADDECGNYFVNFSVTSVSRGFAFGGIFYSIVLTSDGKISVEKKYGEYIHSFPYYDSLQIAFDVIKKDIQDEHKKREDRERKEVIAKLTPRERELLGIKMTQEFIDNNGV